MCQKSERFNIWQIKINDLLRDHAPAWALSNLASASVRLIIWTSIFRRPYAINSGRPIGIADHFCVDQWAVINPFVIWTVSVSHNLYSKKFDLKLIVYWIESEQIFWYLEISSFKEIKLNFLKNEKVCFFRNSETVIVLAYQMNKWITR